MPTAWSRHSGLDHHTGLLLVELLLTRAAFESTLPSRPCQLGAQAFSELQVAWSVCTRLPGGRCYVSGPGGGFCKPAARGRLPGAPRSMGVQAVLAEDGNESAGRAPPQRVALPPGGALGHFTSFREALPAPDVLSAPGLRSTGEAPRRAPAPVRQIEPPSATTAPVSLGRVLFQPPLGYDKRPAFAHVPSSETAPSGEARAGR